MKTTTLTEDQAARLVRLNYQVRELHAFIDEMESDRMSETVREAIVESLGEISSEFESLLEEMTG